jgi:hypothetical protein
MRRDADVMCPGASFRLLADPTQSDRTTGVPVYLRQNSEWRLHNSVLLPGKFLI